MVFYYRLINYLVINRPFLLVFDTINQLLKNVINKIIEKINFMK